MNFILIGILIGYYSHLCVGLDHIFLWSDKRVNGYSNGYLSTSSNVVENIGAMIKLYDRVNVFITYSDCIREIHMNCHTFNEAEEELLNKYQDAGIKYFNNVNTEKFFSTLVDTEYNFEYGNIEKLDEQSNNFQKKILLYILPLNYSFVGEKQLEYLNSKSVSVLNIMLHSRKQISPTMSLREDSAIVVPTQKKGLITNGAFVNVQNCLYFYFFSGYIQYQHQNINLLSSSFSSSASSCASNSSTLVLSFSNVSPFTTISISMTFGMKGTNWICNSLTATMHDQTGAAVLQTNYDCSQLTTYRKLSYMCNDIFFYPIQNQSSLQQNVSRLGFIYAQVQPFVNASRNEAFSSADSCIYFINIPIFMGLMAAVILLISTLFIFSYFQQIKGPSRYGNPKEVIELGLTMK